MADLKKRGEIHLAFAMYKTAKNPVFNTNAFSGATCLKTAPILTIPLFALL